jgi:hypothetical protein
MKYVTIRLLSLLAIIIFFTGCRTPPGERVDPPLFITTFDLHQAKYVERVFTEAPELKGRFRVEPGASKTRVVFKDELPPGKEELFIERMKQLKAEMTKVFERPVNGLVFVFPSKEIKL